MTSPPQLRFLGFFSPLLDSTTLLALAEAHAMTGAALRASVGIYF
jgi:hypothetical protein